MRHTAIQYSKMSRYGRLLIRSIRPVTETYIIADQINSFSKGSLIEIINSIWQRCVIQLFNIQRCLSTVAY
ncbi:hypothetical protein GIB67_004979 [Kingdonia uniflora]|uniref:Uncharacterized protein n=1 Tax=Kingdonia uniflora TaxID=39325 RepID=A0A7J7NMI7_9MAGN|nr:hypothetical protein GIB67_004979 [Kingdonia uniflora]